MSKLLPLVFHPDKLLRVVSRDLSLLEIRSSEFRALIDDMEKTMREHDGIGLAAVQIGKTIRLTVIDTKDGLLPLINPVIIKKSWKKEWAEEGCLSIPGVFGQVRRHVSIRVQALNQDGQSIAFSAKGLFARVIQHELDHLNGVLFIDKAKDINKIEAVD